MAVFVISSPFFDHSPEGSTNSSPQWFLPFDIIPTIMLWGYTNKTLKEMYNNIENVTHYIEISSELKV
jgi:hypothetical protein